MKIKYPEIGICGLSCRLCPNYNTDAKSKCLGCKSPDRIAVGCSFITCALKKKEVEFCWDCQANKTCEKWKVHREAGKKGDSFKCYQTLEDDIDFIIRNGVDRFEREQKTREQILKEMILEYNEGRSKSYYCIACTVMEIEELKQSLRNAKQNTHGLNIREKSKFLHSVLDEIAERKKYFLKIRKSQ